MSEQRRQQLEKVSTTSHFARQDCQPCRYVGAGAFLFAASFIWYSSWGSAHRRPFYRQLPLRLTAVG
ncbi:unnamed protein product [Gongylonema pulchrum]|uniref:Transmembrane protein n=1 Tax=Gongylonema pulchrum TaxID=637853 RepID=A0A183DPB2_9BILA|nr:unnamed protein product [Gongylonema pulchrum]